jgi:hypothetical protein
MRTGLSLYILDGKTPKPVSDLFVWGRWFQKADRHVAVTELTNGSHVSTVFLGIDHNYFFERGPPLLFETMIFGGEHDQYQARCSTWDEAELMHAEGVQVAHSGRDLKKLFAMKEA